MNLDVLFDRVRKGPFPGHLTADNVNGLTAVLEEWAKRGLTNLWWLAYMLATDYHETNHICTPVIETRSARDPINPSVDVAIARLENAWRGGKMPWVKQPYWRKDSHGRSYLGRGLPQLTHVENYKKMGDIVGVDLVTNPDLALDLRYAVPIMFEGMIRGSFTGHKLADFFHDDHADPKHARQIINGMERADLIAGYATEFHNDLVAACSG